MKMRREGIYKNTLFRPLKPAMGVRVCVLDGGGPKDSKNTLNSFLIKNKEKVFWQIGTDMIKDVRGTVWLIKIVFCALFSAYGEPDTSISPDEPPVSKLEKYAESGNIFNR